MLSTLAPDTGDHAALCGHWGNCWGWGLDGRCSGLGVVEANPDLTFPAQTLSPRELWHLVHQCYGSELGLTSEDEDYVCPLQLNGLG